ncbi:hypothetical protein DIPPA_22218 [Diplonema papillatum]|nr:hypothetical protein DIPPA_22218 [Diplonema papillatum]
MTFKRLRLLLLLLLLRATAVSGDVEVTTHIGELTAAGAPAGPGSLHALFSFCNATFLRPVPVSDQRLYHDNGAISAALRDRFSADGPGQGNSTPPPAAAAYFKQPATLVDGCALVSHLTAPSFAAPLRSPGAAPWAGSGEDRELLLLCEDRLLLYTCNESAGGGFDANGPMRAVLLNATQVSAGDVYREGYIAAVPNALFIVSNRTVQSVVPSASNPAEYALQPVPTPDGMPVLLPEFAFDQPHVVGSESLAEDVQFETNVLPSFGLMHAEDKEGESVLLFGSEGCRVMQVLVPQDPGAPTAGPTLASGRLSARRTLATLDSPAGAAPSAGQLVQPPNSPSDAQSASQRRDSLMRPPNSPSDAQSASQRRDSLMRPPNSPSDAQSASQRRDSLMRPPNSPPSAQSARQQRDTLMQPPNSPSGAQSARQRRDSLMRPPNSPPSAQSARQQRDSLMQPPTSPPSAQSARQHRGHLAQPPNTPPRAQSATRQRRTTEGHHPPAVAHRPAHRPLTTARLSSSRGLRRARALANASDLLAGELVGGSTPLECLKYKDPVSCEDRMYWCAWNHTEGICRTTTCFGSPTVWARGTQVAATFVTIESNRSWSAARDLYTASDPSSRHSVSMAPGAGARVLARRRQTVHGPGSGAFFVNSASELQTLSPTDAEPVTLFSVRGFCAGKADGVVVGEVHSEVAATESVVVARFLVECCQRPGEGGAQCAAWDVVVLSKGAAASTFAHSARELPPGAWNGTRAVLPLFPAEAGNRVYFVAHLPPPHEAVQLVSALMDPPGGVVYEPRERVQTLCSERCTDRYTAGAVRVLRFPAGGATSVVYAVPYDNGVWEVWAVTPRPLTRPVFSGSVLVVENVVALATALSVVLSSVICVRAATPLDPKSFAAAGRRGSRFGQRASFHDQPQQQQQRQRGEGVQPATPVEVKIRASLQEYGAAGHPPPWASGPASFSRPASLPGDDESAAGSLVPKLAGSLLSPQSPFPGFLGTSGNPLILKKQLSVGRQGDAYAL